MWPARITASVARTSGAWCQLWTVWSTAPADRASPASRTSSSGAPTSGFSQSTCRPRASAASIRVAWLEGGVQISTKSSVSAASSDSTEACQRAAGSRAAHSPRRAGRASVAATISQSRRACQPGRWPCTATFPRPMTAPRRRLVSPMPRQHRPQRLVQDGQALAGEVLGDEEGRIDPDRRRVGHRHEPAPQALLVEIAGDVLADRLAGLPVLDQLDPEQQTPATHLADGAVLLLEALELGEHDRAHPVRVLDQVLVEDDLERGEPRRGGERIAAVARRAEAWIGPRLGGGQGVGGDHAGEREAASHPLAHRHDVGHDALVVGAPHRAGAAEPGDHLVGEEQRPVIAGHRLDRAQEAVGRDDVARGALDRLHDDRGDLPRGLVADDVAHVLGARDAAVRIAELERAAVAVGVGRRVLAGQERTLVMLEVAAEQAEDAAGLAVEAAPEPDDLLSPGRGLGQAQAGLHRLRAAREELDAREALRSDLRHQLEEARAGLGGEAAEGEPLRLALERLDVVRVAVADAADRDARDEVDVLVAVLVPQPAAAAAGHGQPRVEGEGLVAGGDVAGLAGHDLARARADLARRAHRASPAADRDSAKRRPR